MVEGLFNSDGFISFDPGAHAYADPLGNPYTSVSKVLHSFQEPFDREGISRRMAMNQAKQSGRPVEEEQKKILSSWNDKRDNASDYGTNIHDHLENYARNGVIYDPLAPVIERIGMLMKKAYRYYPEALLYNSYYKVAGQTDLTLQRQKSNKSIFDFFDYKTNIERGIQFSSQKMKDGKMKHYNKFMLPPLDHLEDCNYNLYSLQLSTYAYLAESTWGLRVGRLGIIYINKSFKARMYPVPYLRLEVKAMLDAHITRKQLPAA